MNLGTRIDNFKENFEDSAVVEVIFEVFILGGLNNCLHAGESSVVVFVGLHHFNKVFVYFHLVNVLGDKSEKVSDHGESVDL